MPQLCSRKHVDGSEPAMSQSIWPWLSAIIRYKASADCIYTLHCFKFHKGHTLHYTTALRAVLRPLSQRHCHCNRVLCSYTTSFRPHSFAPAPLPLASYRIDHDNNTLSSCVTSDSVIVHCQLIIIHSRLKPAILLCYSSHSNYIAL